MVNIYWKWLRFRENFGWEEKELTFFNQFIWWNKLIKGFFPKKILPNIFLKKFSYVLKTHLMYNSHCIFQDMFSIPLTLLSFVLLLSSLRWTKLETTTKLRVRGKKALPLSRQRTQTKKKFPLLLLSLVYNSINLLFWSSQHGAGIGGRLVCLYSYTEGCCTKHL